MIIVLNKYLGKTVNIVDVDDVEWVGYVRGVEPPGDSEDGKWWLDLSNVNRVGFESGLTISEDEIKEIRLSEV